MHPRMQVATRTVLQKMHPRIVQVIKITQTIKTEQVTIPTTRTAQVTIPTTKITQVTILATT